MSSARTVNVSSTSDDSKNKPKRASITLRWARVRILGDGGGLEPVTLSTCQRITASFNTPVESRTQRVPTELTETSMAHQAFTPALGRFGHARFYDPILRLSREQ